MISIWWVMAALLVPWLAASLWLRWLLRWDAPGAGRWALSLGYGYLLGLLGVALMLRLQGGLGWPLEPRLTLVLFAGLLLVGVLVLYWRYKRHPAAGGQRPPLSRWQWLAWLAVGGWLAMRLIDLGLEIWWQPLFPWDAWTTWGARARVWTELGSLAPFVSAQAWLNDPGGTAHTIEAWNYPATLSLVMAWPGLVSGGWDEILAKLPWMGAGVGLGLGFYGGARGWGASPLTALVFTWLLLSLPLLDTHIALAGYADLWLAYALGLAFMSFLLWLRDGDPRQGMLTLVLLLACAAIKREGLVWALPFIPALLVTKLSRFGWLAVGLGVVGIGLGLWFTGGIDWDIPVLGRLQLSSELIQLPHIGVIKLTRESPWEPLLRHTFLYSQWHLLPYLIVLALFAAGVKFWRGGTAAWFQAGLLWTLTALAALYVLFFWTEAYLWAVKATSLNRVILHFVPAFTFWLLTVWLEWTQPPTAIGIPKGSPEGRNSPEGRVVGKVTG